MGHRWGPGAGGTADTDGAGCSGEARGLTGRCQGGRVTVRERGPRNQVARVRCWRLGLPPAGGREQWAAGRGARRGAPQAARRGRPGAAQGHATRTGAHGAGWAGPAPLRPAAGAWPRPHCAPQRLGPLCRGRRGPSGRPSAVCHGRVNRRAARAAAPRAARPRPRPPTPGGQRAGVRRARPGGGPRRADQARRSIQGRSVGESPATRAGQRLSLLPACRLTRRCTPPGKGEYRVPGRRGRGPEMGDLHLLVDGKEGAGPGCLSGYEVRAQPGSQSPSLADQAFRVAQWEAGLGHFLSFPGMGPSW